jgi:hypothetical protein
MSIESKAKELKELVSRFDSQWFLGDIFDLMHARPEQAPDQLGTLNSPMRQLYYLAGLNVTSLITGREYTHYSKEEWEVIVQLLNEIEQEYDKLFIDKAAELGESGNPQLLKVAIPTFLSYFNQGPLNYEEQEINLILDTFSPFEELINNGLGFGTKELIDFYNRLDRLINTNISAHMGDSNLLRKNWKEFTKLEQGIREGIPQYIVDMMLAQEPLFYWRSDAGMVKRFVPEELVCEELPIEIVSRILATLSFKRNESDFVYYTDTMGNPLYRTPILDMEDGKFQVCEIKQVIHSIKMLLEDFIESQDNGDIRGAYNNKKGKVQESRIIDIVNEFFGDENFEMYTSFVLDGKEQDVLVIWKSYAIIFEAKAINVREPMRDPERAYDKIKKDFKLTIQHPYDQAFRVKRKIDERGIFSFLDYRGVRREIDASKIEECFIVIVTQGNFGPIQTDLSYLLQLNEEDVYYPWALKMDDLEVFLLTMIRRGARIKDFVNFLKFRRTLIGRVFCSDELEICGGFITRKINPKILKGEILVGHPSLADVFDEQYDKGMGFRNEKLLEEKLSGKYLFL